MRLKKWIADLIQWFRELGVADDLDGLSEFFAKQKQAWLALPDNDRPDPNPLINSIGAIIGNLLVSRLDMQWVVASDEYGTEVAVVGQPGDILIYPMNAVAKRWTGESEATIADLVDWLAAKVIEVRQLHEE